MRFSDVKDVLINRRIKQFDSHSTVSIAQGYNSFALPIDISCAFYAVARPPSSFPIHCLPEESFPFINITDKSTYRDLFSTLINLGPQKRIYFWVQKGEKEGRIY